MKTVRNSLSMLMVVMMASTILTFAQGRGNGNGHGNGNPGRGHDKDRDDHKNHNQNDHDWDHHDRDRDRDHSEHHYDRNRTYSYSSHDRTWYYPGDRYVMYNHHRSGPPSWAPAYGYRYNTRYIYYTDYNVYYDCHRDVFVTWNGRRWIVSTHIPSVLLGVNFNHCAVAGVDYWDDDFDYYLDRKRPAYVNIRASW